AHHVDGCINGAPGAMAVGLVEHPRRAVPKEIGDELERHATLGEHRGARLSQLVREHDLEAVIGADPRQLPAHVRVTAPGGPRWRRGEPTHQTPPRGYSTRPASPVARVGTGFALGLVPSRTASTMGR